MLLPFDPSNVAGSIVLVVGLIGIILNASSFIMLYRNTNLNGSFVTFCLMNCATNTAILIIFTCWVTPSLYLGHNPVYGIVNSIVSQASFLFWLASVNCQVTLASNRFVAIYLPLSYDNIFSNKNMLIYIITFWIITAIAPAIGFIDTCNIYFDSVTFVWQFNTAPCGSKIFFWMGFVYEIAIFVVAIVLDIGVFLKLRQFKIQDLSGLTTATNAEKQRRIKRDIRFFWQAFLTNVNFMFVLMNFNFTRMLARTPLQGFLAVTFVWELGHLIDGLILIVANREHRRRFLHPRRWFSTGENPCVVVVPSTAVNSTTQRGPRGIA